MFLFQAVFNGWALGWRQWVRGEVDGISPAPIIGGLAGFIGVLVAPIESIATRLAFAWMPLVLDLGTLSVPDGGLIDAARERRK
ncbi:MAG: hypothetical protein V3S82_03230 [Dehalococcoidia bacterium]